MPHLKTIMTKLTAISSAQKKMLARPDQRPQTESISRTNPVSLAYGPALDAASARFQISRDLIEAVIAQESGWHVRAISKQGAMGLMQLMPQTARAFGVDASDPTQNIMGGTAYLRYLLDTYSGHIDLVLAAYNAGQGAVLKYGGIPPYPETRSYIHANLSRLAQKSLKNEAVSQNTKSPAEFSTINPIQTCP